MRLALVVGDSQEIRATAEYNARPVTVIVGEREALAKHPDALLSVTASSDIQAVMSSFTTLLVLLGLAFVGFVWSARQQQCFGFSPGEFALRVALAVSLFALLTR